MTALEQMDVGAEKLQEIKTSGAYIPKNLSIVATMNTSDESVYFMDSAFKRRWQFEYIDADHGVCDTANESQVKACVKYKNNGTDCEITWNCLRQSINLFMIDKAKTIRGIEDKQIGLWFVKPNGNKILDEDIQYKLMHYLWDNVFARDKKPLRDLLKINDSGNERPRTETELATFGQFVKLKDDFITKVLAEYLCEKPECTQTAAA
jgi:5-methylcytosine-specific restriction protein B